MVRVECTYTNRGVHCVTVGLGLGLRFPHLGREYVPLATTNHNNDRYYFRSQTNSSFVR